MWRPVPGAPTPLRENDGASNSWNAAATGCWNQPSGRRIAASTFTVRCSGTLEHRIAGSQASYHPLGGLSGWTISWNDGNASQRAACADSAG